MIAAAIKQEIKVYTSLHLYRSKVLLSWQCCGTTSPVNRMCLSVKSFWIWPLRISRTPVCGTRWRNMMKTVAGFLYPLQSWCRRAVPLRGTWEPGRGPLGRRVASSGAACPSCQLHLLMIRSRNCWGRGLVKVCVGLGL